MRTDEKEDWLVGCRPGRKGSRQEERGLKMKTKLFLNALARFVLGVVLVGLLLFVSAGTWKYPGAWLLMGLLFIPMFLGGVVLLFKDPELLARRMKAKEEQGEQRKVIALSGLMFIGGFVLAGLDYRYHILPLPSVVSYVAAVALLLAYILYAEVLRENRYLSRTIEVAKGQKVVDTGLYGLVRHPMYSATILLFLSIPLVFGSGLSTIVFLFYLPIIIKRIYGEEKLLEKELEGYPEYQKKVKYRLLPFVW